MCLPGSYTHYEGFKSVSRVPRDTSARRTGRTSPHLSLGTVRSLRDSVTCKSCPMGTWNPFRGVTDESLCIPCNPGLVCSAEGTENNKPFGDNVEQVVNEFILDCENELETCKTVELQPLGRATLCPEGYVCDARTSVAAVKCPDGYFCGYGTSPETQFVNKCPAGYFCPEGTAASGRFQFPCRASPLLPRVPGSSCPAVPRGGIGPQRRNIDQCFADRITFWRIQPLKRVLIDEAYAMLLLAYNESTSDRRRSLLELGEAEEDLRIGGEYASKPRKYAQGISRSAVEVASMSPRFPGWRRTAMRCVVDDVFSGTRPQTLRTRKPGPVPRSKRDVDDDSRRIMPTVTPTTMSPSWKLRHELLRRVQGYQLRPAQA